MRRARRRRRRALGPRTTVKHAASPAKLTFAREQRRQPTAGERLLWEHLRDGALGPKFRRQHPLGDFVLDFYCPEAKLAVEVDGPSHAERPGYDAWRDAQLARRGVRVLRLPEAQVRHDLAGSVRRICAACEECDT